MTLIGPLDYAAQKQAEGVESAHPFSTGWAVRPHRKAKRIKQRKQPQKVLLRLSSFSCSLHVRNRLLRTVLLSC